MRKRVLLLLLPTNRRSIELPVLPEIVTMLEDDASSETEPDEESATDDEEFNSRTLVERYDLLRLEVDAWTPAKMYRTAALGPFIWGVLRDSPETFNGQMNAMISSGQAITRRLFAFLADLPEKSLFFSEGIEAMYFRVHLAMAGIQMRRRMIKDGFLDMCPQVMIWEDPVDSWTTLEEYFNSDGPEIKVTEAPQRGDGRKRQTGSFASVM
ncbi:hypothetical protein HWV62_325 [Athelia sp. TMB]|nr:hypothetical protein HWV62_325 [Athelia sp. TMB]